MNDIPNKPEKTVDERIAAIAQSLELLSGMQVKTEERAEALTHSVELLAGMVMKTEKQIFRLGKWIRVLVIDHETRILDLEGGEANGDKPE